MMKRLIACCGLDCEHCDARRATVDNDDALRERTARKWSEMNDAPQITAATIHCTGCRTEGVKFAYCSDLCRIRKCVSEKGLSTCGDCREVAACPLPGGTLRHARSSARSSGTPPMQGRICGLRRPPESFGIGPSCIGASVCLSEKRISKTKVPARCPRP